MTQEPGAQENCDSGGNLGPGKGDADGARLPIVLAGLEEGTDVRNSSGGLGWAVAGEGAEDRGLDGSGVGMRGRDAAYHHLRPWSILKNPGTKKCAGVCPALLALGGKGNPQSLAGGRPGAAKSCHGKVSSARPPYGILLSWEAKP
jgi:hypothetical protein